MNDGARREEAEEEVGQNFFSIPTVYSTVFTGQSQEAGSV